MRGGVMGKRTKYIMEEEAGSRVGAEEDSWRG